MMNHSPGHFEAGDKSGNTVFDIDPDDPGPWNIEVYEYNVIIEIQVKLFISNLYYKIVLIILIEILVILQYE